jgi:hypothetical protein
MNKISEEQLEKIVSQKKKLDQIVLSVGALETQKHFLLHEIAEAEKVMGEIKAELENEYGAVSINLETGEYSEIEKEDNTVEVVK